MCLRVPLSSLEYVHEEGMDCSLSKPKLVWATMMTRSFETRQKSTTILAHCQAHALSLLSYMATCGGRSHQRAVYFVLGGFGEERP